MYPGPSIDRAASTFALYFPWSATVNLMQRASCVDTPTHVCHRVPAVAVVRPLLGRRLRLVNTLVALYPALIGQ